MYLFNVRTPFLYKNPKNKYINVSVKALNMSFVKLFIKCIEMAKCYNKAVSYFV